MRVEIHVLQNFAPANLNRDDTGSPKSAEFGGYRRARISSQCIKRAVRTYFKTNDLLPANNLGERTKRLAEAVVKRLVAAGRPAAAADSVARAAVSAYLQKSANEAEHKTPYLLFLGENEIASFARLVNENWKTFSSVPTPVVASEPAKKGPGRKAKAEAPSVPVPEGFTKSVDRILNGGKAADVALFGRMVADKPETNIDASCQVAHALSTNKIHSMEQDYFTAVDDLRPGDTTGADMIGTVEFNSACYYRYANVDMTQLVTNLQDDVELAHKSVLAFIQAFIQAIPTGKQNSFAAQSFPSLIYVTVGTGMPMSLANAFIKPIAPTAKRSLIEGSILALDDYVGRMAKMYGTAGQLASAVCQDVNVELEHLKDVVDSVGAIRTIVKTTLSKGVKA